MGANTLGFLVVAAGRVSHATSPQAVQWVARGFVCLGLGVVINQLHEYRGFGPTCGN